MNQMPTLRDVRAWALANDEAPDTLRSLEKIPARLGLVDADLASLSARLSDFERMVAGRGYALSSQAANMEKNGRRMDSRVRALLARFWSKFEGCTKPDPGVWARWQALMSVIAAHEGLPGSGCRWNIGRHRTFAALRARAEAAPEDMTQEEVDRIGRLMSADKRKGLRKAISFLNSLSQLAIDLPELRPFLPSLPLAPPAGSSWARRMDWGALPESFRLSFERAADSCLADEATFAETLLARIEAGEDPEVVMAAADAQATTAAHGVGKPSAAREQYRIAVTWLVRALEQNGGESAALGDIRDLFNRVSIENAIKDQIARSTVAVDLRDPLASTTLSTRLTALTTLAKRGLADPKAVAIIKLLKSQYFDVPRKKLLRSKDSDAVCMEVDRLFANLRQRPELASIWANAPRRIAAVARRDIETARSANNTARELTALRAFAGAAAYAMQLSRPLRTACVRHARLASHGDAHANLLRSLPGKRMFTFRFAPWEVKNSRWVTVDIAGDDATIVAEWLEIWRPRMIALQGLDPDGVYLFPGRATPGRDDGDPVTLPSGCYAVSSFLDLWRDASQILGVHETPHRMRHVVALLSLALRPGDYAFVSAVLGNDEATARKYYGRDDGQAAARETRAALLAQHPDLFAQLTKRHSHA